MRTGASTCSFYYSGRIVTFIILSGSVLFCEAIELDKCCYCCPKWCLQCIYFLPRWYCFCNTSFKYEKYISSVRVWEIFETLRSDSIFLSLKVQNHSKIVDMPLYWNVCKNSIIISNLALRFIKFGYDKGAYTGVSITESLINDNADDPEMEQLTNHLSEMIVAGMLFCVSFIDFNTVHDSYFLIHSRYSYTNYL